jgi:hypothetical protein
MSFVIRIHRESGVLVAEASGPASFATLCGAAAFVGVTTQRSSERRAVLDLLAVDIELGFTDHLQLGSFVADQLQHLERVASVVPQRYRTGTSEKAAQKGGLLLQTFTDRELAMAWVRER